MIINAENLIVGRFATIAAKKALLGEKVDIVNCEKAIITGKRDFVLSEYRRRVAMGIPSKGPFLQRQSDRIVRRIVRGMLPYKRERGKDAFKRVMCYRGIPESFKNQKMETIKEANVSKMKNLDYITIGEISKHLGAKQ